MKIAVLGVGLIGGSIGLAARRRLEAEVAGFDPTRGTPSAALELGALDPPPRSVAGRGRRRRRRLLRRARSARCQGWSPRRWRRAGEAAVVTDVGSTKRELIEGLAAGGDDSRGSSAAIRSPARRRPGSRTPAPSCSRARAGT